MADLQSLGRQYLAYASANPLEYRLMFGTLWPEPTEHPGLVNDAVHAFDVLRGVLRGLYGDAPAMRAQIDLQAMFVWSTMRGFASITNANVIECLSLAPKVERAAPEHVLGMIEAAMEAAASAAIPSRSTRRKTPVCALTRAASVCRCSWATCKQSSSQPGWRLLTRLVIEAGQGCRDSGPRRSSRKNAGT
jgi:hypothetical protein